MPEPEPRPWISPQDAQRRMGFASVETIYKLITDGTLPAARLGRRWRIDPADVDALIKGRHSTEPPPREVDGGNATIAAFVAQVLAQAPPLTSEARLRLAELLAPPRRGDGAA